MTRGELLTDMAETHRLEMSPHVYRLIYKTADDIDELEAENAKLRERIGELEELTDGKRYIPQEWYAQLKAENAKLRELVARMAEALGIDCEWADPDWCKSPCVLEFGCWPEGDHMSIRCPAWEAMRELGIEVDG